ncbi:MAG: hypothetical protein AB1918_16495 [Pseudomonadota bacterium]
MTADARLEAFARELACRTPGAAAVLFYGSCLRDASLEGILDFYVLTDRPLSPLHRLLPPTVRFASHDGLRAKVAVIDMAAFRRAMRPQAVSTHLWARFCQPVAFPWVRDDEARAEVEAALADALRTAAWWCARIAGGDWAGLFRRTYAAELRAEGPGRAERLAAADHWRHVPLPAPSEAEKRAARQAWAWRWRLGKVLAAARLVKAAFTTEGGIDYLAWKIERHAGRPVPLSPWQRRHPLLAAPLLLLRLRRQGFIR